MDENLRSVWDRIADSWTNLRPRPEPNVLEFSKDCKGLVVDIGCGNCRNLIPFKGKLVGIDFSKNMVKEAKKFCERRDMNVFLVIGDAVNLPIKDGVANCIIYTSVISHIKKREDRIRSLEEVRRVAKVDAKIILSIWNRWQKRFFLKLIISFLKGEYPNVYVDWNYHGKVYKRFYHLYTKSEMKKDLEEVGFIIERIFKDKKGGIWFLVRK